MTALPSRRPTFRFAPSPNGELHLGHALSALLNFELSRLTGGRFLLRIEDIDTARSRPALTDGIYRDLEWLGLSWEMPVLLQSQHLDDYREAAGRLRDMGLLYPCFATRTEIQSAASGVTDPDGAPLYPGLHRNLSDQEIARREASGQAFAMRLRMAEAIAIIARRRDGAPLTFTGLNADGCAEVVAHPERWGDIILQRKDTPTSYHLSVVVDDARQGVTHVVRGLDLRPSTDVHRVLQSLLGLPAPIYHHHALMTDDRGRKLAKSAGDASLREMREQGYTAADIRRLVDLDTRVDRLAAAIQ